jgi:hypothetical protein
VLVAARVVRRTFVGRHDWISTHQLGWEGHWPQGAAGQAPNYPNMTTLPTCSLPVPICVVSCRGHIAGSRPAGAAAAAGLQLALSTP